MIARDFQPLSIVENGGFLDFVKELNPRYKMITRRGLTSDLIPEIFGLAVNTLKNLMDKSEFIAVTTDAWTSSCNNRSFLGITCHFIIEEANHELTLLSFGGAGHSSDSKR